MAVKVSKQLPLTAAAQEVHAVHFQRHLRVSNIHIVNVTGGAVTIQITINPPGVNHQLSTALIWNFSVPANDILEFGEGLYIASDYTINALAGADQSLILYLSGLED